MGATRTSPTSSTTLYCPASSILKYCFTTAGQVVNRLIILDCLEQLNEEWQMTVRRYRLWRLQSLYHDYLNLRYVTDTNSIPTKFYHFQLKVCHALSGLIKTRSPDGIPASTKSEKSKGVTKHPAMFVMVETATATITSPSAPVTIMIPKSWECKDNTS